MQHPELNAMLIEHFGDLERLCNQIYSDRHGVTRYIDDMKSTRCYNSAAMTGWQRTLDQLIAIRHKRNKLSHGEVSFSSAYATEDDIDFLITFRNSILNQTDPLALNLKHHKHQITYTSLYESPHPESNINANVMLFICLAVALFVVSFVIGIIFF